ncbi:MAG: hypothetical protein IPP91_06045 [Betaproteobacteria bacterium]|nr:hypothetical protein [Betaproteobacteria bacterium]
MKLTDLHKNEGLKIDGETRRGGIPDRYGRGSAVVPDRKEQRKLDAAAGLVPFACKLHGDLVKELQARAQASGSDLNETVADVLKKGLAAKK